MMQKRPIGGPDPETFDLSGMVAPHPHHRVKPDAFRVRELKSKFHVPFKGCGHGRPCGPRRSKQLVGPLQWP